LHLVFEREREQCGRRAEEQWACAHARPLRRDQHNKNCGGRQRAGQELSAHDTGVHAEPTGESQCKGTDNRNAPVADKATQEKIERRDETKRDGERQETRGLDGDPPCARIFALQACRLHAEA